jgi:hypothetical protein
MYVAHVTCTAKNPCKSLREYVMRHEASASDTSTRRRKNALNALPHLVAVAQGVANENVGCWF